MDFGKAFSFPFQDPDWLRKIIIPALISLIPILGQIFVLGWALGVTRRVLWHDPTPLPDINFGEQLADGIKALVIGLVYSLPIIILTIPLAIGSNLIYSGNPNQETAELVFTIFAVCCYGIIFIYGILIAFVMPAAYAKMIASGNLGAAFRFGEVIGLVRSAPGPYLMVLVGSILAGLIGGLGSILCVIGVILTYTYSMAIIGHLYGQAYNEATGNQAYARAS